MSRSEDWAIVRDNAMASFVSLDSGDETPHAYACMTSASGRRYGWTDTRVADYKAKFYAKRNADGGWGLNYPFSSPGASVNPADTSYTITCADNVGLTLLHLYEQGLIPFDDIHDVATLLMTTQSYLFPTGRGLCYSIHSGPGTDDVNATNNRNVHNVNAAAGWWLRQAQAAGFSATGLNTRVADIARLEFASYKRTNKWWSYRGNQVDSDTDHAAVSAWFMYRLLGEPVGGECAYRIMTDPTTTDDAMATSARARLTNLPGTPGRWSKTAPGVTQWAELGDRWLPDCNTFALDPPSSRAVAQMAYWASLNAEVT